MHYSNPYTLFASVLAQITNSPPETFLLTYLAIDTFFAISSVEMSYFPSKCPHLFGNT